MEANLNELMAALSADSGREADQIQELVANLARRPVPVNSLHRAWT